MISMTLSELAQIVGAPIPSQHVAFSGFSKDTRNIVKGNLYIAIIGENMDGHQFVDAAFKAGAVAALVSRKVDSIIPQIVVQDTLAALGKAGENWRDRFDIPLIGVTGSNGKTTTKNLIASILTAACNANPAEVFATKGNYNNNIGLPLVLSGLNHQHRYGVIEMGMNHFGEIEYLTQLAKPQVAVITNAASAHLQALKTVAGVAKAKGEIFIGLQKGGTAILNKDDEFYDYWCGLVKDHPTITFGFDSNADVTASFTSSPEHAHQTLQIKTPKGDMQVNMPLLGKHNVANALAATAATLALGIELSAIQQGLENVKPEMGRLNHHVLANGARIIDDSYNANPTSTAAAVTTLAQFDGKKILVLGDMRELGPNAKEFHANIGSQAKASGIDLVFTFGELTAATAESFGSSAQHFSDKAALIAALEPYVQAGHTILVKGSHSMHMEDVVAGLIPNKILATH